MAGARRMGLSNGKRRQSDKTPRRRAAEPAAEKGLLAETWPVVDLFSGCGGMSYGFVQRPPFQIIAAVDAEIGKPCAGAGRLGCNETYLNNIGVAPLARDIASMDPRAFLREI